MTKELPPSAQEQTPSNVIATRNSLRFAYNALHGTELPAHNNLLTKKQAEQINNHFDIKYFAGVHAGNDGGLRSPTDNEYDAVAQIVKDMKPGDALFIEGFGFKELTFQSPLEVPIKDLLLPEPYEQLAEIERIMGTNAWDYAANLALHKGAAVVRADLDGFEDSSWKDVDHVFNEDFSRMRERTACNTIKDWALDNLPDAQVRPVSDRKPQLILLFGAAHQCGIEDSFRQLGLNVETTVSTQELTELAKEALRETVLLPSPPIIPPHTITNLVKEWGLSDPSSLNERTKGRLGDWAQKDRFSSNSRSWRSRRSGSAVRRTFPKKDD